MYWIPLIIALVVAPPNLKDEQIYRSTCINSRQGDPESIVDNVSMIHGDYSENEVDLVVSSPDTLVLSRFYSSRDTSNVAGFGGWRFYPQCTLTIERQFGKKSTTEGGFVNDPNIAYIGNPDGSIFPYFGSSSASLHMRATTPPAKNSLYKFDPEECAEISNTARGTLGMWTNVKNNVLNYDGSSQSYQLNLCTEGSRRYIKSPSGKGHILDCEILPSGNKVFYTLNEKNQPTLIKQTNAAETKVLAWIKITYGPTVHVEASDGQQVDYTFQKNADGTSCLTQVTRSNRSTIQYQYQTVNNRILLVKKILPEGRFVQIDYDKSQNYKVKAVTIPIDGGKNASTTFVYGGEYTIAYAPGDNTALYHFNPQKQLTSITQYLNGSLYRIHEKQWGTGKDRGNLITTSTKDATGNVFYYKHYAYDDRGNVTEEREYGNLTGSGDQPLVIDGNGLVSNQQSHVKNSCYFSGATTHGFFQKDSKGAGIKYWYKKGTNLLVKKLVLEKGSPDSENENNKSGITQRYFYTYDQDAVLIRVIIDDGCGSGENDFSQISQRTMSVISPKQDLPNLGAPEIIEQKYSTPDGKSEFLISKTINRFDVQGNLTDQEIYDADNSHRYTLHKKYNRGLLVFETDPIGNETHYGYDLNQNLISESYSHTGISTTYHYDLSNRLTSIINREPSGNQTESKITYDAAGYKNSECDPFGAETRYTNDALGRPISITYPDTTNTKATYTYTYDIFDHPISVTDPSGKTVKCSYTYRGTPADIYYADGTKENFRYESGGNLHHHLFRNGLQEVYQHDNQGRLTRKIYYNRNNDSFKEENVSYNAFHKTVESQSNHDCRYHYDHCGRLASIDQDQSKVEFTYDSLGRTYKIKRWDNTDFTLEYREYDLLGRVIEERTEDASQQILLRRKFVYNNAGQISQVIGYPNNQESILTEYAYDTLGRITQVIDASGGTTSISYEDHYITEWGQKAHKRTTTNPVGIRTEEVFDHDGHRIQVCQKDPSNNLLSALDTSYDLFGNKVLEQATVLSPNTPSRTQAIEYSYSQQQLASILYAKKTEIAEASIQRFEYDSRYGDLIRSYTPGNRVPISYQYDLCGNRSNLSYEENQIETKWNITYDLHANPTELTTIGLQLQRSYNEHHQVNSETIKTPTLAYQISRTYDSEGKIKSIRLPDGSSIEYSYKGPFVKSITRISASREILYTHTITERDPMGNILTEILPAGSGTRTQEWDSAARRKKISTPLFQDSVIEYDLLNNIRARKTTFNGSSYSTTYDYDSLEQLIHETAPEEHYYLYDSVGNRIKKDNASYTLTPENGLIRTQEERYYLHTNGNMENRYDDNIGWGFHFNPLNQLTSAANSNETNISFTYDLTGRRLTKRIDVDGKKGNTLYFLYIDDTEIGSIDQKGTIIDLKIPLDPNQPESAAIAIEIKKKIYIPIYDLQGNIACIIDSTYQWIAESYRYTAFGEEKIYSSYGFLLAQSGIDNPWRYRGKRIDQETGLIYFGQRYYYPKIGRWMSRDPAGTIDGPNLYTFVHNNPLKYVDYFGLASETNEGVPCQCGFCQRGEGCHCLLGLVDATCNCKAINCNHKLRYGTANARLGGIVHGSIDFFVVDTAHHLGMGAALYGSADLEMGFDARIEMLKAVEQTQLEWRSQLDAQITDALGVDPNDPTYQKWRSGTNTTLTIASIAAVGYGTVRGAMSLTRLAGLNKIAKLEAASLLGNKTGFLGHKGFQLKNSLYQFTRNEQTIIQGRIYSGHALDQMQNRGFMPSVVEATIKQGSCSVGNSPNTFAYFDQINNARVITNSEGKVISIYHIGKIKK